MASKTAAKKTAKKAAPAKKAKAAPKKKAPAKKAAAKKTPAKAPAEKKAPAKKKATPAKKAPAKKKATPAKKAAPARKAAPKKTAEKTVKAKAAPKKAAPKAKASKPAKKEAASKATKATKATKAKTTKAAAKEAPKRPKVKLNVGQKPRSEKAATPMTAANFLTSFHESETPMATAPKSTVESKEAKQTFKVNEAIVYPAHGVGRIVSIDKQHIAGIVNELFVIDFEQEKLKLKVPTAKAISVGMRALSDEALVKKAIDVLKGRARIKRTMWSRRAQEYDAKINSGDIIAVAEVVRDLYRASDQPEQSYSERQLFEAAIDRLAREVAAVRNYGLEKALADLDASLQQKKAAA